MGVLLVILVIAVIAAVFGPQVWVRHVLAKHGRDRPDLQGTGGELARHLLDEAGLTDVKVETTDDGDHYDPDARAVRLLPRHHDGRSIAAVAIAAHEVAHAVQHARGERAFAVRDALIRHVVWFDRLAMAVLISAPLLAIFIKSPVLLVGQVVVGVAMLAGRVLAHAATLPVEFDASFGKALPVLERGRYLDPADMPAARRVLRAAALTYVAAALATLLDVLRWARILRP